MTDATINTYAPPTQKATDLPTRITYTDEEAEDQPRLKGGCCGCGACCGCLIGCLACEFLTC